MAFKKDLVKLQSILLYQTRIGLITHVSTLLANLNNYNL